MFKKKLPFLKRRGPRRDDEDEATAASADLEVPSTETGNTRRPSPTPSGRSSNSNTNSIVRQLRDPVRGSSDAVNIHGQDPLGLKVVHRPEQEPQVDIVFVHGLGGSSRATWSKDRDLDYFWPLQFLSHEPVIKDEARILTFGYNANFRPGSGKNKMAILDFAKDLLFELKYAQDETGEEPEDLRMGQRPIVFVVHSMGGLIVKEAYMQGQIDPTFSNIVKSVSAIIFLSTPHRGTNLAETLNKILQVSFVANPMQFIAELATGSQTLQKLNEQFRHIAPKLEIVSFYETRPTTMFKKTQIVKSLPMTAVTHAQPSNAGQMVLEKDSSVLGYPGEISKPLDADHHGVCKYESRDDPSYITVRNVLKSLVRNAKPKDVSETNTNETWLSGLEELLGVSESPETDYNFFRDRWTAGTCTWIASDPSFVDWLEDTQQSPKVLWIQGNAASGKSILSSFVIDYLVQSHKMCQYFFIRFEDKKKRSLSTLLRSLACQLGRSLPTYAASLRQLEAAGSDLKSSDYRHIWQMMYKQSLFDLELLSPIYWVLDGVEEADSPQHLFNILSELQAVDIPLRILLVSRRTHDITTAAQKVSKQIHVRQIGIDGNKDDFRKYIDREMDPVGEGSYREQVLTEIMQLAQGNFLWVYLAVQKINQCQTRMEVQDALKELPPGMEALYHRMASTIKTQPGGKDPSLGQRILIWATYAQRPLNVEELSDALGIDGLLEIHRTIGQLCGGFVVVDHEGRVALVHETAREYLMQGEHEGSSLGLEKKASNDKLFKRCITRLMDPSLRNLINRDRTPALLEYATSALFFHLIHGSRLNREKLSDLLKFFQSQHVLTWIHVAAKGKKLRTLVVASRYLNEIVSKLRNIPNEEESLLHRQAIDILTAWAADLVKLVGKFGASLIKKSDSIYKLVPPFCPEDSILYQQFGKNEAKALRVSGVTRSSWDDCLARLSLEHGVMACAVLHTGGRIVVLANRRSSGYIYVYNSTTFEEERCILHPERVFEIQADSVGENLVSYGYRTTRVWTMTNGECIKTVDNPKKRPRPQSIMYLDKTRKVLVAGEDRCVRSFKVDGKSTEWETVVKVEEQSQEETYTVLNAPTCSALSPDGDMIAFGYRGHPVTVWDIGTEEQVGQCNMTPDDTGMTTQTRTFGEITSLAWHPFNCEVFGLHREGLLFKWDPYDDDASATVHARAHFLAVSRDGSLVATGDTEGTLKVYTTADLTLIYQLSSQNHVLDIAFSVDSKRLYDIRGDYGNVWEPNALVRLAESSEFSDQNSDSWSETESLAKLSLQTEHHFPGIDTIVSLCRQTAGSLYCYGTENGVAVLGEVGHGNVCEIERMTNFMSIEHVAWSDDGKILAIADLSGRISIKHVSKETSSVEQPSWRVHDEFKFAFPTMLRHMSQLLFQSKTHKLLAISAIGLFKIDADTQSVEQSTLPSDMPNLKWVSHPTQPEYLLAFGSINVRVYSWNTLKEVAVVPYSPPRLGTTAVSPENQNHHGRGSFRATEEKLGRVLSCADSPDIILQIVLSSPTGQAEMQYLMFSLTHLDLDESTPDNPDQTDELRYTLVPPEIASRIREPLALLSRGRFVFLDVDRWICTWRTPNAPRRSVGNGRTGSEAGLVGPVDAHYFLPGDWVTAVEARLCTVAPDGTLLCPRNGDVASVQSTRLRK